MTRSIVAILLAPAFAAIPMIVLELVYDNWKPSLASAVGYTALTYAFTLIPTAILVYALRRLRLKRIWHFAAAGLVLAVVCTVILNALIPGGGIPLLIGDVEITLLFSGVLSGIFVWVISEWEIVS